MKSASGALRELALLLEDGQTRPAVLVADLGATVTTLTRRVRKLVATVARHRSARLV